MHGKIKLKVDNLRFEKEDLEERIDRLQKLAVSQKMKIEREIDLLQNEDSSQVLELYYINFMNITEIAKVLFVSEITVRRWFCRGIHLTEQK